MRKSLIEKARELSAKPFKGDITKSVQHALIERAKFDLLQSARLFDNAEDESELAECVVAYLLAEGFSVVKTGEHGKFYPVYRISWNP